MPIQSLFIRQVYTATHWLVGWLGFYPYIGEGGVQSQLCTQKLLRLIELHSCIKYYSAKTMKQQAKNPD